LSACYTLLDESRMQMAQMREELARAVEHASLTPSGPCPTCATLKAQLSEERALHSKEVADLMADNRALQEREHESAEQRISGLQKELDRLRTEGSSRNHEFEARAQNLQRQQAELQNTLAMVRQATASSDASYERAVEEQRRLQEAQERLKQEEQAIAAARAAL
ncbi:unnamed protein product, partial [Aphanomyces euteiches]